MHSTSIERLKKPCARGSSKLVCAMHAEPYILNHCSTHVRQVAVIYLKMMCHAITFNAEYVNSEVP